MCPFAAKCHVTRELNVPCMSEAAESSYKSNSQMFDTPSHYIIFHLVFCVRSGMCLSLLLFFSWGIASLMYRVGRYLPGKSTGP